MWTYNTATLATPGKDQVRLLIGDVVWSDPQMEDEEIAYFISQRSTIYGAAADCCRALQAKFSRSVDQAAGDTRFAFSQMAKAYRIKAIEYDAKASITGAVMPYAGGISEADKDNQEQDADRVKPQFNIGMEENLFPVGSRGNETPDQGSSG